MKDADTLELQYAQTNLGLYQALRHHNFTYDRGEYGDSLPRSHPAHRALVRDVIGKTAEEMVFAYHSVPWPPSDIHLLRRQIASGALTETERQVYTLRAVNELDDLRDLAPVYVGSVKRQSCIKGAGFAIAIAESLSATALVDALSLSLAAVQSAQVSSHLSGGRDSSYTVTPVRLREQIRRALKYKFRSAL